MECDYRNSKVLSRLHDSGDAELDSRTFIHDSGVSVDLRPFPRNDPSIMVTKRRIDSLKVLIGCIKAKGFLGSGEAASLAGFLGFTLAATFGRFGRCRVRPIIRRAYSPAKSVDKAGHVQFPHPSNFYRVS